MRKRDDILQAAERLFYENGFHTTSIDQLCREAKVSTRTFYRYFPSREILTEAVMAARQQRFFEGLHSPDHPQAISQLFLLLEQWMREYGASGCFFIKAWGEYAREDMRLSALALDFRYALRRYIASCLGSSDAALADTIWILFEGAITSALITGPEAASRAGKAALFLLAHGKEQS